MAKEEFTVDYIKTHFGKALNEWFSKPQGIVGYTGKWGRIAQLENIYKRPLTQQEKDAIADDGVYNLDLSDNTNYKDGEV